MLAYWIQVNESKTVLEQRDTSVPEPGPGQIRVRMRAASLNRGEFIAGHGLAKAGAAKRR